MLGACKVRHASDERYGGQVARDQAALSAQRLFYRPSSIWAMREIVFT